MSIHILRYLGVIIEYDKCELDIKKRLVKFYTNAKSLIRIFGKCSSHVNIQLCRTYCTTLYCGIFRYEAIKRDSHRFRVSYNNYLRKLYNSPCDCSASGMCVSKDIPEIVHKCIWNFIERLILECADQVCGRIICNTKA